MSFLDYDNKVLLAQNSHLVGWHKSVNDFIESLDDSNVFRLMRLLRLRQVIGFGLIDITKYKNAIVIETGIGTLSIGLSKLVRNVYVVYNDSTTMAIVRARCDYLDIKNIIHLKKDEVNALSSINGSSIIVGCDDDSVNEFGNLVTLVYRHAEVSSFLFIHNSRLTRKYYIKGKEIVYHLSGDIFEPYGFVENEIQKRLLGRFKYFFYRIKAGLNKYPQISTDVCFSRSLFFRVIEYISKLISPGEKLFFINGYYIKPLGVLLRVSNRDCYWMIRVALNNSAEKKYKNAMEVLGSINNASHLLPVVVIDGYYNNYYYSVEKCFRGNNVAALLAKNKWKIESVYKQAFELLCKIQRCSGKVVVYNEKLFKKHIAGIIYKVSNKFTGKFSSVFDKTQRFLEIKMLGARSIRVVNHGDFSVDNLMIYKNKLTGVIDWEFSTKDGFPLVDLLLLIASVHKVLNRCSVVDSLIEIVILDKLSVFERLLVQDYCTEFLISPNALVSYRIITIFEFLLYRLDLNDEIEITKVYDRVYSGLILSVNDNLLGS